MIERPEAKESLAEKLDPGFISRVSPVQVRPLLVVQETGFDPSSATTLNADTPTVKSGGVISYTPASVYFDGEGWRDRTNASSLKELDASPVGYERRYVLQNAPPKDSPVLTYGRLLHTWGELLDGIDPAPFWNRVSIAPVECVTATGQFGKASADWLAGLPPDAIPISPADHQKLTDQTAQILANGAAVEELSAATHKEMNIAFDINGHPCKCRVDGATDTGFFDFKTTRDIEPAETFHRACADFKYHLQAAFYGIGGHAAGWHKPRMKFIATSTTYPYHCAVMVLPPDVLREAEQRVYELIRELEQRRALNWWTPATYGQVIEMPSRFFQKRKAW